MLQINRGKWVSLLCAHLFILGGLQAAAPVVDAGSDEKLEITPPDIQVVVTLNGSAKFDGSGSGAKTFLWTVVSGPDKVEFSAQESNITTATFFTRGQYVLRFSATDSGEKGSDELTVEVGPKLIDVVVSRLVYRAAGLGNARSKVSFTMSGVSLGANQLKLQPNDRFFVSVSSLPIGSFTGTTPISDFFRMDFKNKPRSTALRGETFDSPASNFKKVRVRYSDAGFGKFKFSASGGTFDDAFLPRPNGGTPEAIFVRLVVERFESGQTVQIVYLQEVSVVAKATRNGVIKGKLGR